MGVVQVITAGIGENKGYYIDGVLMQESQVGSSISREELELNVSQLAREKRIRKIEFYQFTEMGLPSHRKRKKMFHSLFSDYLKKDIELITSHRLKIRENQ